MTQKSAGAQFRAALAAAGDEPLSVPSVFDSFSTRLVAHAGFTACCMGSSPLSHSLLGLPDAGFLTLSDMEFMLRKVTLNATIPILADVDNGYGNALNVVHTVRTLEAAGCAGIMLEDQDFPRTPHAGTARVIPVEEATGKFKAALDSRKDHDFFIIARTDLAWTKGIEAAIERLSLYAEAGVDAIFMPNKFDTAEVARLGREVKAPHRMWAANGRDGITLAEVRKLGFDLVPLGGGDTLRAAAAGMMAFLDTLKADGLKGAYDFAQHMKGTPLGNWPKFNDFDVFEELERKYLSKAEYDERYGHRR